jgi:hypothetical protein
MSRKEVFVIRIGVSIESVADVNVEVLSNEKITTRPTHTAAQGRESQENGAKPEKPARFHGRDTRPMEAYQGDKRAMSDAQKKALFRLAYTLGDREGALTRVLEALGIERLEWATRADASRAIDVLRGKSSNGSGRQTNGAGHA